MNTMNPTNTPKIRVANPAIISLMAEGFIIDEALKEITMAVSTLDCANNDMAIAMWVRVRGVLAKATRDRAVAFREIERAKGEGKEIDPLNFDAAIATCETTDWVLHSIGRYRGNAAVATAFDTAHALERAPTKLMRFIKQALSDYYMWMFAELGDLMDADVRAHCANGGKPLPPGSRTVKVGRLGEDSVIVTSKKK